MNQKTGFRLAVNSIEINPNLRTVEVIRFIVALGNPLIFQSPPDIEINYSPNPPTSADFNSNYHSLRISEKRDYIIFNSSQIKPCELIKFDGGENLKEFTQQSELCDSCNQEAATIWCINDQPQLCQQCDEKSHQGYKTFQSHRRISLQEARASLEFCSIHSEERVEYYCQICKNLVYFKCKMIGNHSKGEEASHPLITIKECYEQAIQ
jgi:hypothetical protein